MISPMVGSSHGMFGSSGAGPTTPIGSHGPMTPMTPASADPGIVPQLQ